MRKKQLRKLTPPGITAEIKELAKNDELKKRDDSYWGNETYQYGGYYRAKTEGGYLMVSVFLSGPVRSGDERPSYILYFDKEADDFVTFVVAPGVWSNAMHRNLDWPPYFWGSGKYMEQEERETMQEYLGLKGKEGPQEFQEQVRMRQLERRDKKLTDAWDKTMEMVPGLPKDWEKWVASTGISQHFMFYTYKKGGAEEGHCSHCGQTVPIQAPKYNGMVACSHCGHLVQYKSTGKFGRICTEQFPVYLIQRCSPGFIIRKFRAWSSYRQGEHTAPETYAGELHRAFYNTRLEQDSYYYGVFKQRDSRWIKDQYMMPSYYYYCGSSNGKVYPRTLPDLDKRELKHTGLPQMIQKCGDINPVDYLYRLKNLPILEQIVKSGLDTVSMEVVMQRKTPPYDPAQKGGLVKKLLMDRQRMRRLRDMKGGIDVLCWLQWEKKSRLSLSDELIRWFCEYELLPERFQFISGRMSFVQIRNYLIRQAGSTGEPVSQVITTWEDYLFMADRLHLDTSDEIVYRPSALLQRHEEAVRLTEELELSMTAEEIAMRYPLVNQVISGLQEKYGFQNDVYTILAPKNIEDVLMEGEALHHCIDKKETYFERMDSRETYILFLRKTKQPEKPYYTLEVEPGGVIRQKRTEYNRHKKDIEKAGPFLRVWQHEIQERLTKADMALADRSRHQRKETYEDLRKKQVYIHGGVCQGELLADVLEADLMEMPEAA